MVKISFKPAGGASSPPPAPERSAPVKLSFKPKTPSSTPTTEHPPILEAPASAEPKQKRKYVKKLKVDPDGEAPDAALKPAKKRVRKDDEAEDGVGSTAKRQPKQSQRAGSITLKIPPSAPPRIKIPGTTPSSALKLSFGNKKAAPLVTTPRLKVKALGKKPTRPIGVGYDSEDEEAEDDPAIESQFILRMQPGEDCDYLRKAIADSAVKHKSEDKHIMGPNVWFRFFDKEGRRGVVSVRGHLYATTLLDLPCIIEGMKSWDKKGWFKTADICQMLLVLGRVKDEEEAKRFPLPREVDQHNWQYPHGLTPPMHWVRKRRFRKRLNVRTIERVENDVEELLRKDKECKDENGTISFDWIDPEEEYIDDAEEVINGYEYQGGDQDEDDQDGDGDMDVDSNTLINLDGEEEGDDEFTRMMEEALAAGDDPAEATAEAITSGVIHKSPDGLHPPESAFTPASGGTISATEGESQDEGGESDEDEGDDEDEDAKAERQARQQQIEEIDDLKKEIAELEARRAKLGNPLLKGRVTKEIEVLQRDLNLKLSSLGMPTEED
jgi:transcription initiation factor TFIID subunit 7